MEVKVLLPAPPKEGRDFMAANCYLPVENEVP